MKLHPLALVAAVALAALVGYALGCQRCADQLADAARRYESLREHMTEVRFMATKITPDDAGMEMARAVAFRLAFDPDELPQP